MVFFVCSFGSVSFVWALPLFFLSFLLFTVIEHMTTFHSLSLSSLPCRRLMKKHIFRLFGMRTCQFKRTPLIIYTYCVERIAYVCACASFIIITALEWNSYCSYTMNIMETSSNGKYLCLFFLEFCSLVNSVVVRCPVSFDMRCTHVTRLQLNVNNDKSH